jgi:2,3-bisphosphoglycerate-independent phosphoglycerate mutase
MKKITPNTAKKVLLIVLDGIGIGKDYEFNAVRKAKTPFLDSLLKEYPNTILQTSGNSVGLPKNTMGGSEVGHFTLGAGRIVYQSLELINKKFASREIFENQKFKKIIENCKKQNSKLHLIGMISDAGVHSHINHLKELLKYAESQKIKEIYIHAITDGRDTEEKSAIKFINIIKRLKIGKIASIVGRFYAMDRDKNYERTKKAYDLITQGIGIEEKSAKTAIENEYKRGTQTDYYISPIILDKKAIIEKNDQVIFFNFRSDRASQLTSALIDTDFKKFKRPKIKINLLAFGPYTDQKNVLFPTPIIKNNLSEILSKNGKKQLKMAETEKFAHVTFFFNSQNKKPYKNEKDLLIPSAKVKSYAEKPEMSAFELTETLIKNLNKKYDFILINFANGDLVGHSGNFEATKKSIETLDKCLKDLIPKALKENYEIIITADHGNAEYMKYENGENCASHTKNPVFCILVSKEKYHLIKEKELGLYNIAPTILELMNIKKPKEMDSKSLIKQ